MIETIGIGIETGMIAIEIETETIGGAATGISMGSTAVHINCGRRL